MKYELFFDNYASQCINIKITSKGTEYPICFHLPKWRPGRYELQQYDRLVSDFEAIDEAGVPINISRIGTHQWEVNAKPGETFHLQYSFYANRPDAGGSWLDEDFIYINGINLFLYTSETLLSPHELMLHIPSDYQIACGLEGSANHLKAQDFHQLVDAPLLAGKNLQHDEYEINGIPLHLWFAGECKPDFAKLKHDFGLFSQAQLDLFGEFPVPEYHFLFVARPIHARHGVEHYNSTVIAMGPGPQLMNPGYYESLMEISSHELFHTWNVKALRPKEMYPYDYGRENYSQLHYVTEGITTYYGDLMLWKGKYWALGRWIQSINGELQAHFKKGGKDFVSLEAASFGSWTNGYHSDGFPNRKISFYTKGYLVAFLTDVEIRRRTSNQYCLDDVIKQMYHQIAKADRGYTHSDYQGIIEQLCGSSFEDFFQKYISDTEDLLPALQETADYFGLNLKLVPLSTPGEAQFGIQIDSYQIPIQIENVLPGSPADKAGLTRGDEVVALGGIKVGADWEKVVQYLAQEEEVEIHYFHNAKLNAAILKPNETFTGKMPQFQISGNPNPIQKRNLELWQSVKKHVEESLTA